MTEVRKWYIGAFGGEAQARPCSPAEFEIIHASEGRYFVLAEDFDNATCLFLDAAERCVASERREKELQQRLTAADERVDVLEALLLQSNELFYAIQDDLGAVMASVVGVMRGKVFTALKPAERTNTSGKAHCPNHGICHASDETCAGARARIDSLKPAEGGGDE